jgi:hypothetical protein
VRPRRQGYFHGGGNFGREALTDELQCITL